MIYFMSGIWIVRKLAFCECWWMRCFDNWSIYTFFKQRIVTARRVIVLICSVMVHVPCGNFQNEVVASINGKCGPRSKHAALLEVSRNPKEASEGNGARTVAKWESNWKRTFLSDTMLEYLLFFACPQAPKGKITTKLKALDWGEYCM